MLLLGDPGDLNGVLLCNYSGRRDACGILNSYDQISLPVILPVSLETVPSQPGKHW